MPNDLRVVVPWFYVQSAVIHGVMERCASKADGRYDNAHPGGAWGQVPWQRTAVGYIGEMAVAYAFDLPWVDHINTFGTVPDVGPYQVRTTANLFGNMFLYNKDREDEPFIFVIHSHEVREGVVCFLKGECMGWQGKRRAYWNGERRCYEVPTDVLSEPGTFLRGSMTYGNT